MYRYVIVLNKAMCIFILQLYTLSMDSAYLRKHLGGCLVECLVEVSEKRPSDPIEFMAHWLYKHMDNLDFRQNVIIVKVYSRLIL